MALKQGGGVVRDFVKRFRTLSVSLHDAPEEELIGYFYSGLRDDVKTQVRVLGLKTIAEVTAAALRIGQVLDRRRKFTVNELVHDETSGSEDGSGVLQVTRGSDSWQFPIRVKNRGSLLTLIEKALADP